MQVMHLAPHDDIEYYENEKERGIVFKKGIDPKVLNSEVS